MWIFPILTSADHLVGIWLPQHAIKITRKIPTVKFLNPPRCSSTNSTEIPSRSLSSLEIYTSFIRARIIVLTLASCLIQIFCYRLKEISKKKKKMKNRQKLRSSKRSLAARITESKKTSRVFAANYHRRPSYLAALFNHDAIIKLSLHAAILDTRSILYDEALTL